MFPALSGRFFTNGHQGNVWVCVRLNERSYWQMMQNAISLAFTFQGSLLVAYWKPYWSHLKLRRYIKALICPKLKSEHSSCFLRINWFFSPLDLVATEGLVQCKALTDWTFNSSVQFSRSVVSDSLWSHESQHSRPPCPSPSPGVHSNSRPSSRWCHPASVVPFSSCPQSLPASESFPMS